MLKFSQEGTSFSQCGMGHTLIAPHSQHLNNLHYSHSLLLKRLNIGSLKQCHTIAEGLVFGYWKSRWSSNGVTPNGGAKCRYGTLNAAEVAENWRLSTRSIINSARSQIYHTIAVLQCITWGLSYPIYTIQLVVQPVWQLAVSCKQTSNRLSNRLYNRFDNWLNKQPVFVQPAVKPGCTTGLTTGCIHDTAVVNPVVKLVWQQVVSCKRGFSNTWSLLF